MTSGENIVASLWVQRKPLLLLGILVSLGLGLNLRHLEVDNALDIWFLEDDPALLEYRNFQQSFGHDELIVIALQDDVSMLSIDAITRARDLSEAIVAIRGVSNIDSILNRFRPDADWSSAGKPLPAQAIEDLHRFLHDNPALQRRWTSADERLLILIANIDKTVDVDRERERILEQLRATLDAGGDAYHLAGFGVIFSALNQASTDGSALVTGCSYGLILVLLLLLYQKIRPLLIIIAVASLGAVAVMGAYAASGRDINMVTMIIPTLILVTSVSTSVHLMLSIARVSAELPVRERIVRGVGVMFWPCLINAATTGAGFISLMSSPMPVIYDLGLFAAIGLIFTFALSLCVTLALSVGVGIRSISTPIHQVGRIAVALTRTAVDSPRAVCVAALGIALLAAFGIRDLRIDTYSIEFLFEDHTVRQDSAAIERNFGAYMTLDFTIEHPRDVMQIEILERTVSWQNRVVEAGHAQWSHSAATEFARLAAEHPDLVDSPSILRKRLPARLIHGDTRLRVSFGVPMQSARQIDDTIDRISQLADFPAQVKVNPAGYLPLYVQMMHHIVETQLYSFTLAFALVMVVLSLLFRSVQQLLLIAISNLLPVLILLGSMGWMGIRLDAATVTIAAIVFGLVVDDTVQFLYRYREERKQNEVPAALMNTATSAGHAMTLTTLVMMVGFSVLGFAAIKSIVFFGLLVALAMFAALLTDLLVLPAVLTLRSRESA